MTEIACERAPTLDVVLGHTKHNVNASLDGLGDRRAKAASFCLGLSELVQDKQVGLTRQRIFHIDEGTGQTIGV